MEAATHLTQQELETLALAGALWQDVHINAAAVYNLMHAAHSIRALLRHTDNTAPGLEGGEEGDKQGLVPSSSGPSQSKTLSRPVSMRATGCSQACAPRRRGQALALRSVRLQRFLFQTRQHHTHTLLILSLTQQD